MFPSLPLAIKWLRENAQQNRSIRFQVHTTNENCRNNINPLYLELVTLVFYPKYRISGYLQEQLSLLSQG